MARIVWDRRKDISQAYETIQPETAPSYEDFRPPSTIESDFTRLLNHNVPHVNWTFELIHDWYMVSTQTAESLAALTTDEILKMYEKGTRIFRIHETVDDESDVNTYYYINKDGTYHQTQNYKPTYIRGQQTSIDWKSKIGNSDMSTNFKTDYRIAIQKGDYVIREDGMLYMLNWNITLHANNQATQSVECNAVVDFTRQVPDKVDQYGYLVEDKHREIVARQIPISHVEYAGRPDYSNTNGLAGVNSDHLISVYLQWNKTTRGLRLDDEFVLGDFTYRIINISLAQVQIDLDFGVITINAKRVAGGVLYDTN